MSDNSRSVNYMQYTLVCKYLSEALKFCACFCAANQFLIPTYIGHCTWKTNAICRPQKMKYNILQQVLTSSLSPLKDLCSWWPWKISVSYLQAILEMICIHSHSETETKELTRSCFELLFENFIFWLAKVERELHRIKLIGTQFYLFRVEFLSSWWHMSRFFRHRIGFEPWV